MNSTLKADHPKKSSKCQKNPYKSKGCSFSYILDLLSFPEERAKEIRLWGKQTGKEGGESAYCSLIMLSCHINELLWEMDNYQRFLAGDREVSPQSALLVQSRGKYWVLPTHWIQESMHAVFVCAVLNRSLPFLIWQSMLTHCFTSDDVNGTINGDFSQLTGWCERGEWLYYSSVLCSDFLCLY